MTMKLGLLNSETLGARDAFHVPGVVVQCDETLCPGDSVRFSSENKVEPCPRNKRHGIVDIFLKENITAGNNFWIMLSPDLVEKLTHQFEIRTVDGLINKQAYSKTCVDCGSPCNHLYCNSCQTVLRDSDDGCRGCY